MSISRKVIDSMTFNCRILSVTPVLTDETFSGGPVGPDPHGSQYYTVNSNKTWLYILAISPGGRLTNFYIFLPPNRFNSYGQCYCYEEDSWYKVAIEKASDNPYIRVKQVHCLMVNTDDGPDPFDYYYPIPLVFVPPNNTL